MAPCPTNRSLYGALGDLYVEKERYQDGAEAYRAFSRRQPIDPDAPLLLGRATDAYAKGGFTSLVLESKAELVEQYGPKSAYWRAHANRPRSAGQHGRAGESARPRASLTTRWRRRAARRPTATPRCAGIASTSTASIRRRRRRRRA